MQVDKALKFIENVKNRLSSTPEKFDSFLKTMTKLNCEGLDKSCFYNF